MPALVFGHSTWSYAIVPRLARLPHWIEVLVGSDWGPALVVGQHLPSSEHAGTVDGRLWYSTFVQKCCTWFSIRGASLANAHGGEDLLQLADLRLGPQRPRPAALYRRGEDRGCRLWGSSCIESA